MSVFIDFNGTDNLPDGVTAEVLNSDAIQGLLKTSFDSLFEKRFEVEASGLKATNAELKGEKAKLKGYLDEYKGIDLKELEKLRELAENNGEAVRQIDRLTSERDAIKESFETRLRARDAEYQQIQDELFTERLLNEVSDGVRQHNAAFPTVRVKDGQERWIKDEAKKVFQRDEKGNFVPMNGDRVLTGRDGNIMTFAEWVNDLREKPDFAEFFQKPAGGGAAGSGGAGGKHFNPKDLAGSPAERQAAIAAKFNLPK